MKLFQRKRQKNKLEDMIYSLIDKAELFLDTDPKLCVNYLYQANILYDLNGYDFKINCRINDVCFAYGDRWLLNYESS